MPSYRLFLMPTLVLGLALGAAADARAGEAAFTIKTTETGLRIGWKKGDTSRIDFLEGKDTSSDLYISQDDATNHASSVLLGARNVTYTCKVSGWTAYCDAVIRLTGVRRGGKEEGVEELSIKARIGGGSKAKLKLTHISGPVVAKLSGDNTLVMQ